jgi:L-2-hydroxyglutarate oxidase
MPSTIGIVGGGIIGMATARELLSRRPDLSVTVLEKEDQLARHQTGRNSGVLHTGIYYAPGSLKAALCTRGRSLLAEFCRDRGLPYEECGKLVIALDQGEERRLESIYQRARANNVPGVRMLRRNEIADLEPNARGSLALYSPKAAIVDFAAITRAFAEDVARAGGRVQTRARVEMIEDRADGVVVATTAGHFRFDRLVICAGLYADVLAERCGDDADPRIVPFRGDYMALRSERSHLVRGLIYPVPDPRYPFLGVHLTRTVHGTVLVGPNAILALAREGYAITTLDLRDIRLTLAWPGARTMFRRHWRTGVRELRRSIDRRAFVRDAQRYVPDLRYEDVVPARSGVRAQAVARSGELLDDFRISELGRIIAVRNAPSPAATSSMALAELIGKHVLAA